MACSGSVFVEPEHFCNVFFPNSSDQRSCEPISQRGSNPFANLSRAHDWTEAVLRATFIDIVDSNGLVPGLTVCECDKCPDPSAAKIDQQEAEPVALFSHKERATSHTTRTRPWVDQVMPIRFHSSRFWDTEDSSSEATAHAELVFAVQQRVALFMLSVTGSQAQFIRLDRSGTIVTTPFDYVEHWLFFCDVLRRIGQCSETQFGFDPTATRVYDTDPDYVTMREAANMEEHTVDHCERVLENGHLPEGEFAYVRQMFRDSLAPEWPRYRVKVPVEVPVEEKPEAEKKTEAEKTFRDFLIGKPVFCAKGMAGRGTRGYVALDCTTKKFMWLKDVWRIDCEFVEREGEILATLNKAQVVNVPTMFCHGDIAGQKTETPDWWDLRHRVGDDDAEVTPFSAVSGSEHTLVDPSSPNGKKRQREADDDEGSGTKTESCPLRLHQHYRLVVEEVAMPLDRFQTPLQLVQVIFDAVLAHEQAANMSERPFLHRDISSGNILIYPRVEEDEDNEVSLQWGGILADWELSKLFQKDESEVRSARQPVRTGTWQYLSVALLSPGVIRVGIADELESFFHVLLYYALRYIKTANCNGLSVANFLDRYFNACAYEDGMYTCSTTKRWAIQQGKICVGSSSSPIRFDNPLDELFDHMLSWFKARYTALAYEDLKKDEEKWQQSALAARNTASLPNKKKMKTRVDVLRVLAGRPRVEPPSNTINPPSEEEMALAEYVQSHDAIVVALGAALCAEWPEQMAEDQTLSR